MDLEPKFTSESNTFHINSKVIKMLSCKNFCYPSRSTRLLSVNQPNQNKSGEATTRGKWSLGNRQIRSYTGKLLEFHFIIDSKSFLLSRIFYSLYFVKFELDIMNLEFNICLFCTPGKLLGFHVEINSIATLRSNTVQDEPINNTYNYIHHMFSNIMPWLPSHRIQRNGVSICHRNTFCLDTL